MQYFFFMTIRMFYPTGSMAFTPSGKVSFTALRLVNSGVNASCPDGVNAVLPISFFLGLRIAIFFFLVLLNASFASAQIYTDASANLPTSASGANMDVRAADLDGDGDPDLVFAREFQANFLLRNNGAGVFTNGTTGNLPQEIHDSEDVAIADFNGDGHLDLVFCSEDDVTQGWSDVHEYYLGDGTGKFVAAVYQIPDSEANAVITTDLNSDGFPDLLLGNKGVPTVLINNGSGLFTVENNRAPAPQRTTQDLAMIDVDGDG
ncbi:MAG: VCBS repeat-containing protein, partial [Saprospiraceae bacterium]|nr:VCBS repeat-containing protein [Saprospiraceae bacterium]